jgi:hypothetical protein
MGPAIWIAHEINLDSFLMILYRLFVDTLNENKKKLENVLYT